MIRALRILFLIVFTVGWLPQGGAEVRFPTLERVLEKIDAERSPEVAKEIRQHASPSDLCGVKAVLMKSQENLFGFGSSSSLTFSPMKAFDVFVLVPTYDFARVTYANFLLSSSLPHAVLLPPPRFAA